MSYKSFRFLDIWKTVTIIILLSLFIGCIMCHFRYGFVFFSSIWIILFCFSTCLVIFMGCQELLILPCCRLDIFVLLQIFLSFVLECGYWKQSSILWSCFMRWDQIIWSSANLAPQLRQNPLNTLADAQRIMRFSILGRGSRNYSQLCTSTRHCYLISLSCSLQSICWLVLSWRPKETLSYVQRSISVVFFSLSTLLPYEF